MYTYMHIYIHRFEFSRNWGEPGGRREVSIFKGAILKRLNGPQEEESKRDMIKSFDMQTMPKADLFPHRFIPSLFWQQPSLYKFTFSQICLHVRMMVRRLHVPLFW